MSVCGSVLLGLFVTSTAAAHGPAQVAQDRPHRALIIESGALPTQSVFEALALRLPDWDLRSPSAPRPPDASIAYVRISQRPSGQQLTLILDDGRAFYRTLPANATDASREAATILANLIAGIEAGHVEPDDEDVALPPETEPEEEPELEEEPEPAAPTPPPDPPAPETTSPAAPSEGLELGLSLGPTVIVGVGPPSPAGLSGIGGQLELALRWPKGLLYLLGMRGAGLGRDRFALGRFAAYSGVGYAFRRRGFEALTTIAVSVEPWWIAEEGRGTSLVTGDEAQRAAVLLGGFARIELGYRHRFDQRPIALRISARVDAAGSATPAGRGGVPQVRPIEAQDPLFRLGGFELCFGANLGLWFAPRRSSRS